MLTSPGQSTGTPRGRRLIVVVAAIAAVVGALIGTSVGVARRPAVPLPALVVADEALNFGEVYSQPAFRWTFRVENRTDGDIAVSRIDSSCGCTAVTPETFIVPARGSHGIVATLDLMAKDVHASQLPSREFTVQLAPRYKVPGAPHGGWTLRGVVLKNPLLAIPSRLLIGPAVVRGESPAPQQVVVTPTKKLGPTTVSCDPPSAASVAILELSGSGNQRVLSIVPSSQLPVGPFAFLVNVDAQTEAGVPLPRCVIPVTGHVVEDPFLLPSTMMVGARTLGETVEDDVIIGSRGGKEFAVSNVRCSAQDISVTRIGESQATDAHSYHLRVHVSQTGHFSGTVSFLVKYADDGAEIPVELRLVGYGTDPARPEAGDSPTMQGSSGVAKSAHSSQ